MVMFTMLVLLTSGAITLVVEREQGLLRRLASTPISPGAIVLGKWAARMMLGLVQIGFAMLVGHACSSRWTGARRCRWSALVLVGWAAFTASLALVLANVTRTQAQTAGIGVLRRRRSWRRSAAAGGRSRSRPPWMQTLSLALPTGWTMDALHQLVNFGDGPSAAFPTSSRCSGRAGARLVYRVRRSAINKRLIASAFSALTVSLMTRAWHSRRSRRRRAPIAGTATNVTRIVRRDAEQQRFCFQNFAMQQCRHESHRGAGARNHQATPRRDAGSAPGRAPIAAPNADLPRPLRDAVGQHAEQSNSRKAPAPRPGKRPEQYGIHPRLPPDSSSADRPSSSSNRAQSNGLTSLAMARSAGASAPGSPDVRTTMSGAETSMPALSWR